MLSLTAYPYNGPLHYLRDIFVCFLLLPVILAALQKVPRTTVILAIMVFVWGDALADALGDVAVPLFLRPGVPALFTVGLALRQGVIRLPRRMWSHVLLPSGVALALLVLIPAALDPSGGQRDALQPLVRMVGVVFVWAGCEALAKGRLGSILWRLEPYVFFVFCSHKITLFLASSALGKVFQWQFPPTIASAYFLAAPVLCFAVAVTGQKVGEAVAPGVVRCLAGGRAGGVQLAGEAVAGHVRREAAFDDRTRLS